MIIPEAFRGIWKGDITEEGTYALANAYPCELVIGDSKVVAYYDQSRITAWSEPSVTDVSDIEITLSEPRCKRINGHRAVPCNKAGTITLTLTDSGLRYRWSNSGQVCIAELDLQNQESAWVQALNVQIANLLGSAP